MDIIIEANMKMKAYGEWSRGYSFFASTVCCFSGKEAVI